MTKPERNPVQQMQGITFLIAYGAVAITMIAAQIYVSALPPGPVQIATAMTQNETGPSQFGVTEKLAELPAI